MSKLDDPHIHPTGGISGSPAVDGTGNLNKTIAGSLGMSIRTAEHHRCQHHTEKMDAPGQVSHLIKIILGTRD